MAKRIVVLLVSLGIALTLSLSAPITGASPGGIVYLGLPIILFALVLVVLGIATLFKLKKGFSIITTLGAIAIISLGYLLHSGYVH